MNYSNSFQDNISPANFNSTSNNILNWIKENRTKFDWAKDPNAYEMINLFLFGAKYAHEGKYINKDSLTEIWNIRSQDFKNCNINKNNFVYTICKDAYQAAMSNKPLVNDENSHHALRKIAGIGLYLHQQKRDNSTISYNNPNELLQLLESARSLSKIHPDLFAKYSFKENINFLCNLQLANELSPTIYKAISDARNSIFNDTISNKLDSARKQ